jgi:hypothetical protein
LGGLQARHRRGEVLLRTVETGVQMRFVFLMIFIGCMVMLALNGL